MATAVQVTAEIHGRPINSTEVTELSSLPPDIECLAERSRRGCQAAFEALVEHFEARIYHYIYQMTRNEHDAQDLTQITFLKAYQNIGRYRSSHAFQAWLFTIAKRSTLNHFRDRKPAEELDPERASDFEDPSTTLASEDTCGYIWSVAKTLTRDQYEALWLRYGEGFSVSETASVMQTNGLRVRVLLHRARSALAKKLHRALDKPAFENWKEER